MEYFNSSDLSINPASGLNTLYKRQHKSGADTGFPERGVCENIHKHPLGHCPGYVITLRLENIHKHPSRLDIACATSSTLRTIDKHIVHTDV